MRAWMPIYIADYLADTGHLSTTEHGAYLLLIFHYWTTGGLPSDDVQLARIARMSKKEWKTARPAVSGFFDSEWRHKRIDRELAEAVEKYEKRAAAGRKGGKRPKGRASNDEANGKQCLSNALAGLNHPQSQPHSSTDVEENNPIGLYAGRCAPDSTQTSGLCDGGAPEKPKPAKRATQLPEDFSPDADLLAWAAKEVPTADPAAETAQFCDHHRAKGTTAKDWRASWRTWMRNAVKFSRGQLLTPGGASNGAHQQRRKSGAELIDDFC